LPKKNKRKTKSRELPEYEPPFESEELEEQPKPKYKIVLVYVLDQDEINRLLEASSAEYVEPPGPVVDANYATYTEYEADSLVSGNFYPRKKKKHGND
jgi:hypothetical protein